MKKHRRIKWFLGICILGVLWTGAVREAFTLELADQRLSINGTLQQEVLWHVNGSFIPDGAGYDITNFRTTLKLEGTWHAIQKPDYQLDLRVVFKNFYDAALDIDGNYRHSMGLYSTHNAMHDLRYYDTFRDICREIFLNFITDRYAIAIGKQIINWGETSAVRMADVVNPVDLLGLANQAFMTNFYDLKRGLFMGRFLFTPPNAPLSTSYELLIIPEFEPDLYPPWGAYPPIGIVPPFEIFKPFAQAMDAMYSDRPKTWGEPQIGFRTRGQVGGFDLSILYFYGRATTPIFDGNTGYKNYLIAYLGDYGHHYYGRSMVRDAYAYPFFNTFGFTLNRPFTFKVPLLFTWMDGNILHIESVLDYQRPFNRFTQGGGIVKVCNNERLNRYGLAVGWDSKVYIPWLTPRNNNNYLKAKFQLFQNWIQGRKESDEWGQYGTIKSFFGIPPTRRSSTKVTAELSYDFFKTRLMPFLYFSHNTTTGEGMYSPSLTAMPFNNWMITLSYVNYYHSIMKHTDYMAFGIERDF